MTDDQFIPVNEKEDWVFFDPDCAMTGEERTLVRRLSDSTARSFWEAHVSANRRERHPALLPPEHWLSPTIKGPGWLTEQSPNHLTTTKTTAVSDFLNERFSIAADEDVHFVFSRERIYLVTMGVFMSFWEEFLYLDDEFPFLFHVKSGAFACFGPDGGLSFGKKQVASHEP